MHTLVNRAVIIIIIILNIFLIIIFLKFSTDPYHSCAGIHCMNSLNKSKTFAKCFILNHY